MLNDIRSIPLLKLEYYAMIKASGIRKYMPFMFFKKEEETRYAIRIF